MTRGAKAVSLALMWAGILFCSYATIDISVGLPITVCLLGAIGTAVLLFWVRTAPANC